MKTIRVVAAVIRDVDFRYKQLFSKMHCRHEK